MVTIGALRRRVQSSPLTFLAPGQIQLKPKPTGFFPYALRLTSIWRSVRCCIHMQVVRQDRGDLLLGRITTLVRHLHSGSGPAAENVREQLQCFCCSTGCEIAGKGCQKFHAFCRTANWPESSHLTMPALRPQPAAMPARISTERERGPGHRSVCRSGILKSISRPSLWVFVGEQTENKESQLRALHPTCAMGHSR